MSWDKNTINFSEVDTFIRAFRLLGIPHSDYKLRQIGKVLGRGLNDRDDEFYILRRLEVADKIILEYIERHSDCDIDDVIKSVIFDKDKVPKRWRREIFVDDA